ncbi:hypothetical protein HYALB_00001793 [Hymenoscyphus albidus]|uniref:PHD-type domain-containing protein n=1 Tax=Hymenoscyphus albidus TaxID=595503 RepID=A0A9N9LMJ8_9HELO|nr:hypothetical protein HYALB_00001793 [Hymenoscyphus albidus]
MDSDAPPKSPTANASGSGTQETPLSDSPPKYVPQFSATTEMILKRIQSGASATMSTPSSYGITGTPPGYEDMRRNVLMGMKTTLNMEVPDTPTRPIQYKSRSAKGSAGASSTPKSRSSADGGSGIKDRRKPGPKSKGARVGTKRKRAKSESMSDEEESDTMSKLGGDSDSDDVGSVTEFPKVTQSGRQIVKPAPFVPAARESTKRRAPAKRTQEQALCKTCSRGHSPQNNMIVFCDGCNLGWHQMCHDPIVSEEMVKDETAPWFCSDCSRKRGIKTAGADSKHTSWQGRSSEEKRSYFNSLPHQQLVSLLMQATVLHPNIPIFPPVSNPPPTHTQRAQSSDRRANIHPQQPFPPSGATGLFPRAESHPHAPMNFIRKIPSGQTPPASFSPSQGSFNHASLAPSNVNPQGDESRESTPASPPYPKAGNGLMAKLGPDEDDTEWLLDNNDFAAFSHTIFDENGMRMEENGLPV